MGCLKVRAGFRDLISILTAEEKGILFDAMLKYAELGEEPAGFDGSMLLLWKIAKQDVDETTRVHELQRQKGLLGGRPKTRKKPGQAGESRGFNEKADESRGFQEKAGESRGLAEEKERSKEKEEDIKRDNDKYLFLHQAFERFWAAYPRHENKEAAWNIFRRLNPDAALLETMLKSVELSKQSDQWRQDSGKYIPYPANWLKQRRWEDEPPKVSPGPVGKTVTAQEYSQRDYAPRRDRAMESFLAAVARMEAEEAMENRTEEEEGA